MGCDRHQSGGLDLAIEIVLKIFYNNKQKLVNDAVVNDTLHGFKKRQRANL